jgi:hypothetical protein
MEEAPLRPELTLASIAFAACALGIAQAQAQVFSSNGAVPIVSTSTTQSTIHVTGGPAPITSLHVIVRAHYAYDSDLDMALVHGDTYLRLTSCNGDSGHDYFTRFSDTAPQGVYEGTSPFFGSFRPEGGVLVPFGDAAPLPADGVADFSDFVGQVADGDWTLWIDSTADGNAGQLLSWSLEFNGAVDPAGPPMQTGPLPAHTWIEQVDAGETLAQAQVSIGNGPLNQIIGSLTTGDTDLYQIQICDPASFSATTVGGTYLDTQLFLFDATGHGVTFNDEEDGPTSQSLITSTFIPTSGGTFYLAVTAAGRVPVNRNGLALWLEEPAVAERVPDGPGATHALSAWIGEPLGGDYRITLTGACFAQASCGTNDFNGDGDVATDADITAFFNCLRGDCCPTCASPDFDGDGNIGTDADIRAFFRAFSGGC